MIDDVREAGRTVFLSSHILPEVERVADRVGIIRRGHLVVVDDVSEIKQRAVRRLTLRFAGPVDPASFQRLPSVIETRGLNNGSVVEVTVAGSVDPVIKKAAEFETISVSADDGDLEGAFLAFYSEDEGESRAL